MSKALVPQDADEHSNKEEQKEEKSCGQKIKDFVIKNYLPISFTFAVVFGSAVPQVGVAINHKATQYICVCGMFLYCGIYLRTNSILEAVKAFKAALWGLISIMVVTSLVGGYLTSLLPFTKTSYASVLKNETASHNGTNVTVSNSSIYSREETKTSVIGPEEFKIGLQVYFCMPCTISSGIVMVNQLNGNFALAILLTVVANIMGVVTVPLLLKLMFATAADFQFDIVALLVKLLLTLLLPIVVGKSLRFVKPVKNFVTVPKRKMILRLVNISLLALLVLVKVSVSSKNGKLGSSDIIGALFVIVWALTVHVLFLVLNTVASFLLKLEVDQRKCIIILASQKTLAVGITVVTFLPTSLGDQGVMAVAMVISHISIILFDSFLVPLWLKFEKKQQKKMKERNKDLEEEELKQSV